MKLDYFLDMGYITYGSDKMNMKRYEFDAVIKKYRI